jgi:hypothetical protein
MTHPVDPLLPSSRAQALKALLAERPPRPRRLALLREWLATLFGRRAAGAQ